MEARRERVKKNFFRLINSQDNSNNSKKALLSIPQSSRKFHTHHRETPMRSYFSPSVLFPDDILPNSKRLSPLLDPITKLSPTKWKDKVRRKSTTEWK